jgi:hypothetical protein
MMIGYVHKTTKIWRLWNWQTKRAIECSNTIFREDENAIEPTMDNAEAAMQRYDNAFQFPTDNEEIDDSNADNIIEDMSRMLTFILTTAPFFYSYMANVATDKPENPLEDASSTESPTEQSLGKQKDNQ